MGLVLAVLALGAGCDSGGGAYTGGRGPRSPVGTTTASALASPSTAATGSGPWTAARIDRLLARARSVHRRPHVPGYDRDCGPGEGCVFGTDWSDDTTAPDGHNGCDTRNDVLREQLEDVVVDPDTHGCKVVGGRLVDPYTGRVMDAAVERSQIQVDHLFPLAAAWDLGAAAWDARPAGRLRQRHLARAVRGERAGQRVQGRQHPGVLAATAQGLPLRVRHPLPAGRRPLRPRRHRRRRREVIGFVEQRSCPG